MIYNEYMVGPETTKNQALEVIDVEPTTTTKGALAKDFAGASLFHEEFNESFASKDKQSEVWDQSVLRLLNNPKQLLRILKANNAKLYTTHTNIYFLINYFGSADVDNKIKLAQLSNLKNNPEIDSIKVNGNNIVVTKKDGTVIESMILSKTFGWLLDDQDLETSNRMGKSHEMSVQIARNLNFPCKVVTGQVYGLTSKSKYLHSWVETTLDGKPMVIDYTMNSIMNKDGYYALRHAKAITKIRSNDIEEDIELLAPHLESGKITGKEYLVYRDKIMEMLTANETE